MPEEYSISISRSKLEYLFHNVRKLDGARHGLARKLRISSSLLDNYLNLGQEYINKYNDRLSKILDIDTEFVEENFELKKNEIKEKFLKKTEEVGISDRNRGAFDVYYYDCLCKHIEKYVYEMQKNVIENTEFETDKKLNKKIKILIQFKLVYDRAQLSLLEEKLYLKAKFSKTSSKHLGVIIKDLERHSPEDFVAPEKEKEKSVQQIGTINNIFQLVQALDNNKQQIEQKEDIVDIEYEVKENE